MQLQQGLEQFKALLSSHTTQFWLLGEPEQSIPLQSASELITNLWHQSEGDGRRTDNIYGLIGVSSRLIPVIQQLNQIKQRFQSTVKAFRESEGNPLEVLHHRSEALNKALQQQGLARLHLKQCYRQIPLLEQTPDKVTFSWYSSGRSLRKITIAEAEKRLLQMDQSQLHIQMQLKALGKLTPEEALVQIQPQVPVMRANIRWKKGDSYQRKARNCPLPLFFPLDAGKSFPEYNVPPLTPPETRQRQLRSDLVIDSEPYLPSLRVHRYTDHD